MDQLCLHLACLIEAEVAQGCPALSCSSALSNFNCINRRNNSKMVSNYMSICSTAACAGSNESHFVLQLSSAALRKVSKELQHLQTCPPEGIRIQVDEANLANLVGWIGEHIVHLAWRVSCSPASHTCLS
jgi:hypothetical protein